MSTPNDERLLTISEAAKELGIHRDTLRKWANKGTVPHYKLPGSGYNRFSREQIEDIKREMHRSAGQS